VLWLFSRTTAEHEEQEARFTLLDYMLVWPLLLTKREGGKVVKRGLTRREIVGWLIFGVIALLAVLLTPSRR